MLINHYTNSYGYAFHIPSGERKWMWKERYMHVSMHAYRHTYKETICSGCYNKNTMNWVAHAKMGTIKDRNGMDLTEIEEVSKNPNDLDNHNGLTSYLQTDIHECEAKWALGSITTKHQASLQASPPSLVGVMGFKLSYFKF